MRLLSSALALLALCGSAAFGQAECTAVHGKLVFCAPSENLAEFGAMSTAFPNAVYTALTPEDNEYGWAVAVLEVRTSGNAAEGLSEASMVRALIQNATSKLWVEASVSDLRYRGATSTQGWPGVQAEYRIVGASERFGTNYVVDAYLVDESTIVAVQTFSDADRKITDKLRRLHERSMTMLQVRP